MITFALAEEETAAQTAMRDFAREKLAPAARHGDEQRRIPAAVLDALWQLGVAQARTEEGATSLLGAIVLEELAAGDAAAALAIAGPLGYAAAISAGGSSAQVAVARELLASERFRPAAIAVVEPRVAFDVARLDTVATPRAEGFVLNGVKSMVPFAADGVDLVVLARLGDSTAAFVVPAGTNGVRGTADEATLGLRGLRLGEIHLENAWVPASARLATEGAADRARDAARVALAAVMTGLARSVLDYVVPYTKERVAHGEALAQKQTIAFRIADMHLESEAMRWMHWRAAVELDKSRSATRLARLAQVYAAEQVMTIADEGLQMLGGHGFTREHPVEMWYRNARSLSVLEGVGGA